MYNLDILHKMLRLLDDDSMISILNPPSIHEFLFQAKTKI